MVPTIPWMKQKFAEYNQKYFGGKLPVPDFSVEALNGEWGRYDAEAEYSRITRKITKIRGNGTIVLTSQFSRPENAVISTLLHEMCHEYVYLVMKVYPKNIHGQEFMSVANLINGQGWAIAKETPITDDDIEGGGNPDVGCTLCVMQFDGRPDFKWWVSKIDGKDMNKARATAKKIPNLVSVNFFHCDSNALYHVKSDPINLPGWGGMVYRDVAQNIARFCGEEDFNVFMGDRLKKYVANSNTRAAKTRKQRPQGQIQPQVQQQTIQQPQWSTTISESDIRSMVSEAVKYCLAAKNKPQS